MNDVHRIYNVGDKAWWATCGTREVKYPCPVCFGKLEVELILGNGESVILPCDCCGHGINAPTGTVKEWEFIAEPQEITITGVDIEQGCRGEKRRYRSGNTIPYPEDICDTLAEAAERCAVKVAEKADENLKEKELKKKVSKTYTWNAGYHMRGIENAQRDLEYHERMARVCKERARPKP